MAEWSTKIKIVDLIYKILLFLFKPGMKMDKPQYSYREYFDIDRIYSWKNIRTFPIKLIRQQMQIHGLLALLGDKMIVLEQSSIPAYYITSEEVIFKHVTAILKSKTHPNKILIQLRRKHHNYGLELISEEYDLLVEAVSERVRTITSQR